MKLKLSRWKTIVVKSSEGNGFRHVSKNKVLCKFVRIFNLILRDSSDYEFHQNMTNYNFCVLIIIHLNLSPWGFLELSLYVKQCHTQPLRHPQAFTIKLCCKGSSKLFSKSYDDRIHNSITKPKLRHCCSSDLYAT